MIITYEGRQYPFDFEEITVKQAIKLEKHTGMKLAEWDAALQEGNVLEALQALGWLILDGGDLGKDIADTDFKFVKLGEAFAAVMAIEQAAQAAAEAAGPTRNPPPPNGSGGGPIPAPSLPSSPTG